LTYLSDKGQLDEIQYEAADIDNNGIVNWDDYDYIVDDYLTLGEKFPAGVWQFEEVYVDFTSRAAPDTSDLWGITEGDVEGMWEPSGRDINIIDFDHYAVQYTQSEFQIDITANNNNIAGFNFKLAYPSDQINIIDIAGPDNNLNYIVDEEHGMIKIVWLDENLTGRISGEQLLTLTVEAKSNNFNNSSFELMDGSTIIDSKGEELQDVEVQLPMLKASSDIELSVNTYPNPVVNQLHISVNLNEANSTSISIFNINGQLVSKTNSIILHKGEQTVSVDTQNSRPVTISMLLSYQEIQNTAPPDNSSSLVNFKL